MEKLKIKDLTKYDLKDYDFHTYQFWCTKDELMLFIKTNYPDQWSNLIEQFKTAEMFYNTLINKELIEIKLI